MNGIIEKKCFTLMLGTFACATLITSCSGETSAPEGAYSGIENQPLAVEPGEDKISPSHDRDSETSGLEDETGEMAPSTSIDLAE